MISGTISNTNSVLYMTTTMMSVNGTCAKESTSMEFGAMKIAEVWTNFEGICGLAQISSFCPLCALSSLV
jgi:hypothetical protein